MVRMAERENRFPGWQKPLQIFSTVEFEIEFEIALNILAALGINPSPCDICHFENEQIIIYLLLGNLLFKVRIREIIFSRFTNSGLDYAPLAAFSLSVKFTR